MCLCLYKRLIGHILFLIFSFKICHLHVSIQINILSQAYCQVFFHHLLLCGYLGVCCVDNSKKFLTKSVVGLLDLFSLLSILNNSMVNILENMDIHVNYHGEIYLFSLNFVKVEIELKHRKVSIPVSIHSRDIHRVHLCIRNITRKKK